MLITHWLQSVIRSRRGGKLWGAHMAMRRMRRYPINLIPSAIQLLEDRLLLTVQTFSIAGGASVMEDPTNAANQVQYTIGFNGALTAGETASVSVNQALGPVPPPISRQVLWPRSLRQRPIRRASRSIRRPTC
jgi:hypothetical protein